MFVPVFVVDLSPRSGKLCERPSFNFCSLVIGILVELPYSLPSTLCKEWFPYNGSVASSFIDSLISTSLLETWAISFL